MQQYQRALGEIVTYVAARLWMRYKLKSGGKRFAEDMANDETTDENMWQLG
jgi:hypothetical protein